MEVERPTPDFKNYKDKRVTNIINKASQQLRISGLVRKNAARRYITITNSHASLNANNNAKAVAKGLLTKDPSNLDRQLTKGKSNLERHMVVKKTPELVSPLSRKPHIYFNGSRRTDATRISSYPDMTYRRVVHARSMARMATRTDFLKAKELMMDVMDPNKAATLSLTKSDEPAMRVRPAVSRESSKLDANMKTAINRYASSVSPKRSDTIPSRSDTSHSRSDIMRSTDQPITPAPIGRRNRTHPESNRESTTLYSTRRPTKNAKSYLKPVLPRIFSGNVPFLFKLNGPILLTAPHGIKLWRGGTDGRKKRIHYREIWSTEIVLKLSAHINKYMGIPASFMIWDRRIAAPLDHKNLDPNYLTEEQLAMSPWHEALLQFKRFGKLNNCPLLHIDVHGKKNRKTNLDVDFGFKALETRWKDQGFVGWVKSEAEASFNRLFDLPCCETNDDSKYTTNVNPSLCGDWGGDLYTMTCQSVCMGVPAFQLEIPRSIRTHLIDDEVFMNKFAKCIVDIYRTCISLNSDEECDSRVRENRILTEYIEKLFNEHIKIQKVAREKQI